MAEGFPTFLANVRLHPGMNSLVSNELGPCAEGFPTLLADARPLTFVDFLMPRKVRFLIVCFPTFLAFEGLLANMSSLMLNKAVNISKGPVTLATLEAFLWSLS